MVGRVVKSAVSSSAVSSPSESELQESSCASSDSPPGTSEYSSGSESHSGPAVHRARAARVSRRRWRNEQSKSRSALLPLAEPASTSLWTTREKQFEKFRASLLAMPVPEGVSRIEKAKGYSLHVMSVLNWVLPDSILHTSAIPAAAGAETNGDDEEEPLITLGVHVSLFHAVSKRFFGNTWVSPELAIDPFQIKQARHPKDGTLRYIIENALLNFRAYFITDIIDANCVGVLELVAYEKDPDSKATVRVVGCGWTLFPLFTRQRPAQGKGKSDDSLLPATSTSGDSISIFTGSPRALWDLDPTAWNGQEKHEGCKFFYHLVPYEPLLCVSMFLRKNELVGALDPIPGLKHGNLANIDIGNNPKLLLREEADTSYEETLASFVKIASLVPKSVQVEDPFELTVIATRVAVNLREEIEANLVSRLKISRKAVHEGAALVEGEVSARVLKIALHNGRCFRTRQFTVPLKADPNGGDLLFCVRNSSKLRGFVFHPNMAIIVVLQYTVHFRIIWPPKLKQQTLEAKKPPLPEEDVILVAMGARALVPSDGKKLFLYDKHHNATAVSAAALTALGGVNLQEQDEQHRVLHVDLLSGPPCRPYSDNTLYTPPDQVAKSLQNRDMAAKDSFAFCDLRITIDGELPADEPSEEVEAPASPTKPAEDNNQTDEDDCAAEEWAKKLLGKAQSNSVMAQTLNALATSPAEEDKEATASEPRQPSPAKKMTAERSEHTTPTMPDVPTAELSRASKTLLTRYGYMESHNKQPVSLTSNQKTHDKRKAPKHIEPSAKSINTEVSDSLKANEVRFHFAAYRACSPTAEATAGMPCDVAPAKVYFTFQFYNFPPTRTETLRLSKAFDNGAGSEVQTFLLMRDGPANKPSQAIQFDVDTTATQNPLETRRFAEYLKWNSLYVDVWDAESLFQLGTFAIPLHELLRQGNAVKKFQAEIEISPPLGGALPASRSSEDDGRVVSVVPDKTAADGASIGRIQLLMSNYGLKGEHYVEQAVVPDMRASAGSTATPNQQPATTKHRVRARRLVETNEELYRLLSQEGFYADRRGLTRATSTINRAQNLRSVGDVNTLTPKEVGILCALFRSRKGGVDDAQIAKPRSTRIKCDLEGRTGLLALLSLKPPEIVESDTNLVNHRSENPTVTREAVENEVPARTTADHAARLKRVLALATKSQVALADAFAMFDSNKDGFLSRQEFIQALRSLGTVFADLTDEDLGLLGDLLDTNKDGNIEYREFRRFLAKGEASGSMTRDQWRDHIKRIVMRATTKGIHVHQVFAELDTSGDGKLSLKEFEQGLYKLGLSPDSDQQGVQELLAELDKDHDGQISYSEFLESLGISIEENKREAVKANVKDITEDVREILKRLAARGVRFDEVFVHFDTDRNGTLSVEEFTRALNQLLHLDNKDNGMDTYKAFERDAVEVFVKSINADGDFKIDYREFLSACGVSGKEMQKEADHFQQGTRDNAERKLIKLIVRACAGGLSIQEVFKEFDVNSDGNISLAEFQVSMQKLFLGQGLTEEDAAFVAARFDTNKDGMISGEEFQKFGDELRSQHRSLVSLFNPVLDKLRSLDQSSKLAQKKWAAFCRDELGFTLRSLRTEVPSLILYFGLVDQDDNVDVPELCSLCTIDPSSTRLRRKSEKDDAVEQLRMLLSKAKEQGVDLKNSFAHFDANGDGKISREELKRGLLALGCFADMSAGDSEKLLERLDEDHSGTIDFHEFRSLVNRDNDDSTAIVDKEEVINKLKALLEKAMEKGLSVNDCFSHFDKDGDGNIKREEFVKAMAELGLEADQSVIRGVIDFLDRNGSGTISLSEFKQLFPVAAHSPRKPATKQEDPPANNPARSTPESVQGQTPRGPSSSTKVTTQQKLRDLLLNAEASGVDVKQCFAHFDSDQNGVITKSEFVGALKLLPGFEAVNDDDILAIVNDLDKDGNDSVSLEEFDAFLRRDTTQDSTREVDNAANRSDRNEMTALDGGSNEKLKSLTLPSGNGDQSLPPTDSARNDDQNGGDESIPTQVLPSGEIANNSLDPLFVEEGDMSLPPTAVLTEGIVVKAEQEHTTANNDPLSVKTAKPDGECSTRALSSGSPKPSKGEAALDTQAEPSNAASVVPKNEKPMRKPPVRSSSFGKGKSPGSSTAPFRRTKTDSEAVSGEVVGKDASSQPRKAAPQRVSFAARTAAKREEIASKSSAESTPRKIEPFGETASDGMVKFKDLLVTAAARGVSIQQSFNHFDKNNKGALSYDEFAKGLRELGPDFANLPDDDIAGMARALDGKQCGELRVEDFVDFTKNAEGGEDAPPKESSADVLEANTQPQGLEPSNVAGKSPAATKRPPPLRRSGSTRTPAKSLPRPLSGTQSARAGADESAPSPGNVVDKPMEAVPGEPGQAEPAKAALDSSDTKGSSNGDSAAAPQDTTALTQQRQGGIPAKFDCGYTFHNDPEIRAVEFKLRKTALEAYHRGILPLRIVAKFLEGEEDSRGRIPGETGREGSRKKKTELLRVEFLQVLMELGFTLLSDQDNQDENDVGGGLPRTVPRMNDHLYARQLERLSRYKQHTKGEETRAHKQLMRAVAKTKRRQQRAQQEAAIGEDSLRRFHEEKSQLLRVLSYYRDAQKKSLVYSLLRQQVTTSLTLFPSFGELLFLELPFVNPYNNNDRFRIEVLLPSSREINVVLDLEIVRSSDEWTFYRENLPLSYGYVDSSKDVEKEMIDDQNEVVLDTHDQLHIPMRLRWLDTTDSFTRCAGRDAEDKKKAAIPVSVVIKSCSHSHTVALFNMEVKPQPFICHRVLRFSHPGGSIWRWKLRYPRGKFVVCMDPSVAMELLRDGQIDAQNSGLASFRCRVGEYPALEMFYVVLYDDKYYACVYEVWQVRIQSKLRVDVHAVLGQSIRHELVIKGDSGLHGREGKRHVKCFTPTQHQSMVQFRPSQVFSLVPQAFNRIELNFCAVETAVGNQMVVLANLVDVETHELVGAWSVHVTLALPVISKTYELRLPVGRAAQKKISYANPWDQPQTIVLRSSAPRLLVPKEPMLQLPSNGQAFLRLAFAARPQSSASSEEIYLFINDQRTDQNEECLLFQVSYE